MLNYVITVVYIHFKEYRNLKILSSQKRGGWRGVSIDSSRLAKMPESLAAQLQYFFRIIDWFPANTENCIIQTYSWWAPTSIP
jgi:hypothetical protein